jgi:hypothetical protein
MKGSFYLRSPKNLAELFTFTFSIVALIIHVSADQAWASLKSPIYSITIIIAYLVFLLRLNKLPYVGVYVLVFREVLKKSLKFLVTVVIVMTGFLIVFYARSDFDQTSLTGIDNNVDKVDGNFFTSVFLIIEIMLFGFAGMSDLGPGMTIADFFIANYVNLTLFMSVFTIVLHNLFLGFTVEELSKMVDDAELQYIIIKIEYTMRVINWKNRLINLKYASKNILRVNLRRKNDEGSAVQIIESGFETMRSELKMLKTSVLSSDSLEAISRVSEQIKVDKSVLSAKMDEILQKINTS